MPGDLVTHQGVAPRSLSIFYPTVVPDQTVGAAFQKLAAGPPGIRQRANGRYEGRVKVEYRSYSVYADTITETKKKMRELKYKLDHGLFVEKEKITLDEWNKTWMVQYKKNRVKNSTYNSYQKYYKGAISKRLGKKNIVDIRPE